MTCLMMEWNVLHTILALEVVAGIMSVTMPLLSIKDLAVATFHQSGAWWDDLLLYKGQ